MDNIQFERLREGVEGKLNRLEIETAILRADTKRDFRRPLIFLVVMAVCFTMGTQL